MQIFALCVNFCIYLYYKNETIILKFNIMKNLALKGFAIAFFSIAATLLIFAIINTLKLI